MSHTFFQDLRPGSTRLERLGRVAFRVLLCAWSIFLGLVAAGFFVPLWPGKHWPHGVLLLLACCVALANAARNLPLQNVLAVACVVGGMGGLAHGMSAVTGIPFGPCVYTLDIGRLVFDFLPWPMPFVWITFVVVSRGTARLVLRPWRSCRSYGYCLLGLSVALIIVLDLALEVFASKIFNYWEWRPTKLQVDWYGVPLVNFLGWAMTGFLILAFVTPFLINKSPRPAPRADLVPLLLWTCTSLVLAGAAFQGGAITAAVVQLCITLPVAVLAVWGVLRCP